MGHFLAALVPSWLSVWSVSRMFTHCVELDFSETKRPIMMKLHIRLHHDIVSAMPLIFIGQRLTLIYFCSVLLSQIYIYQLRLAPFLKRLNNLL